MNKIFDIKHAKQHFDKTTESTTNYVFHCSHSIQ